MMSASKLPLWLAAGALGSAAAVAAVAAALGGRAAAGGGDWEAIARMLASENPSGGAQLWIEQVWTQIRSAGNRTLAATITGGTSYGTQGGRRPVSTDNAATSRTRDFAASFLGVRPESQLTGARRFFEPIQQDRAFAVGESARRKRAAGQLLSEQEARLIHYKSDAAGIRARWSAKRHRYVGTIEGVEFWT
jgi:hypothetical protein